MRAREFAKYLRRRLSCQAVNSMGMTALEWRARGRRRHAGQRPPRAAARGAVGGADGADDARFEQGGMDTNVFSANLLISEIEASARRRHPAAAVW